MLRGSGRRARHLGAPGRISRPRLAQRPPAGRVAPDQPDEGGGLLVARGAVAACDLTVDPWGREVDAQRRRAALDREPFDRRAGKRQRVCRGQVQAARVTAQPGPGSQRRSRSGGASLRSPIPPPVPSRLSVQKCPRATYRVPSHRSAGQAPSRRSAVAPAARGGSRAQSSKPPRGPRASSAAGPAQAVASGQRRPKTSPATSVRPSTRWCTASATSRSP